MNWVAPIKDLETLKTFEEALLNFDRKYYIMFKIGVGTGSQLQDILKLQVKDLRGQDSLTVYIGVKKMVSTYVFPEELKQVIAEHTASLTDDDYVFYGHKPGSPLTREQAYRALKMISMNLGISSVGAQTMRKTYAWNYYRETGDIHYLQELFNHASPVITYRFIGERPNIDVPMEKMTAAENERSRKELVKRGSARIDAIIVNLNTLKASLTDPSRPDSFFGTADCLLEHIESITADFEQRIKD